MVASNEARPVEYGVGAVRVMVGSHFGFDVVRHDVMIGAAPFILTLIVMIVLLILVPEIAMWLPNLGR